MKTFTIHNPWHAGLFSATALSLVTFFAYRLVYSGHVEWSFCLLFASAWLLLSLFWANDSFNEQSGLLLAEFMDEKIEELNSRISKLETQIEDYQLCIPGHPESVVNAPRTPVPQENWV